MAGFNKMTMLVLVVAFLALVSVELVAAARVEACDEVCYRTPAEKSECCRAHGYSGQATCYDWRMYCS